MYHLAIFFSAFQHLNYINVLLHLFRHFNIEKKIVFVYLCSLINVKTFGTNETSRFQLKKKKKRLRKILN